MLKTEFQIIPKIINIYQVLAQANAKHIIINDLARCQASTLYLVNGII